MIHLDFQPDLRYSENYRLEPESPSARQALAVMMAYGNLPVLAQAAVQRYGYGNSNYGHGLEYPTRPERVGQVRIWYWQWCKRKGPHPTSKNPHKIKVRKYHLAENIYLAVLAGVLEAHGLHSEAATIGEIMPLAAIAVSYQPNIYSIGQYKITPFATNTHQCLMVALALHDLPRSYALAQARQGFVFDDQSLLQLENYVPAAIRRRELRYAEDGKLHWLSSSLGGEAQTTALDEALYLQVLEQLRQIHGFIPGNEVFMGREHDG
jgi:hypothetical protein